MTDELENAKWAAHEAECREAALALLQERKKAKGERMCICANPENCTERVPGYRCKKDFMPRAPFSDQLTGN